MALRSVEFRHPQKLYFKFGSSTIETMRTFGLGMVCAENGPKLPFVVLTNTAAQSVIVDIGTLPQHH